MIRLTDEQWERIRDHFPEETIIRSVIESRFSASVKGSFGQPLNSRQIHYEGSRDPQAQPPFGLPHYASPVGASWMWTLALGHHEDRTPTHGYAATREDAMAAFAKNWRRE